MKYLIACILFVAISLMTHTLANAQDEIILFHSDTCPHCTEVLKVIEENELNDVLDINIIERDDDGFNEIFRESLEDCGRDPDRGGYPTLYHNGECSVGRISVVNTLLDLAGIEIPEEEKNEEIDEDVTVVEEEMRPLEEVEEFEREPRPITHILMMIIGPALLIALGYYMIKKLNL